MSKDNRGGKEEGEKKGNHELEQLKIYSITFMSCDEEGYCRFVKSAAQKNDEVF